MIRVQIIEAQLYTVFKLAIGYLATQKVSWCCFNALRRSRTRDTLKLTVCEFQCLEA